MSAGIPLGSFSDNNICVVEQNQRGIILGESWGERLGARGKALPR